MKLSGYVLFWFLLGIKVTCSHTLKTRLWSLLGVPFETSNEHTTTVTVIWEVPPRGEIMFQITV